MLYAAVSAAFSRQTAARDSENQPGPGRSPAAARRPAYGQEMAADAGLRVGGPVRTAGTVPMAPVRVSTWRRRAARPVVTGSTAAMRRKVARESRP